MISSLRRADDSQLRLLDSAVLLWCAFWVAVGVWVGHEIWQLSHLGQTLSSSGRAIDDTGRALQELRNLPLVGGRTGALGDDVRATARDVVVQGRTAETSTRRLAVLLGITTGLVPLVPAAAYVPVRLAVSGDRRRVRAMVGGLEVRELDAHLARRALLAVPYDELRRASDSPERDFAEGRHRALADAELRRLGLRRTGG